MTNHSESNSTTSVAERRPLKTWVALFLGSLIGAVVALVVYFSFNRPVPVQEVAKPTTLNPSALLPLQEATNEALRAEIARLKSLLAGDVCAQPEIPFDKLPLQSPGITAPEGTAPDGGASPEPGSEAVAPLEEGEVTPSSEPTPAPKNVADLLAQATVFVFNNTSKGFSFGSGFFVAPGIVVTNRHVVDGSEDGGAYITNPVLGGVARVKIIAISTDSERDYAILQIDDPRAQAVRPLTFSEQVARTDRVSAWGYPGLLVEADPQFAALVKGDSKAVPEVTYSEGVVSVVMHYDKLPAVIHTADLSQGNSGGPLVNTKGQVVAINTLILFNDESKRQTSISLGSADLVNYLRDHKVPVVVEETAN